MKPGMGEITSLEGRGGGRAPQALLRVICMVSDLCNLGGLFNTNNLVSLLTKHGIDDLHFYLERKGGVLTSLLKRQSTFPKH